AECYECENLDEFTDKHGADIAEYLHNVLTRKIECNGVLFALRFVELEDDDEDELDEDEVINNFRRWF
ncbi:MAG: hypothetical protein K2I20_01515, partial [Clostridia bacterium]|nr:hypothetical protein [Clostridia bacterium]